MKMFCISCSDSQRLQTLQRESSREVQCNSLESRVWMLRIILFFDFCFCQKLFWRPKCGHLLFGEFSSFKNQILEILNSISVILNLWKRPKFGERVFRKEPRFRSQTFENIWKSQWVSLMDSKLMFHSSDDPNVTRIPLGFRLNRSDQFLIFFCWIVLCQIVSSRNSLQKKP